MIKSAIETNEQVSPNSFELETLKLALPQFFDKDGAFKFNEFKDMLSQSEVDVSKESFELNFLGKSYAKFLAGLKTETVLVPDVEHNALNENKDSENSYIVGDNLEVLKHLLGSYRNKIKCIYIDPPYNTGSDDFAYNDTFNFSVEELVERVGLDTEEAERVLDLQGKASHSAWLTFMLPRLIVARQLLSEDGVIFISLDENEQANLNLLCDEIYGEQNKIGVFVQDKGNSKSDSGHLQKNHEYILCYSNITSDNPVLSELTSRRRKVLEEEGRYFYLSDPITTRAAGGVLSKRDNLGYTFYFQPDTGQIIPKMDYNKSLAKNKKSDDSIYQDDKKLIADGFIPIRPPRVRKQLGAWTWGIEKAIEDADLLYPVETKNGYTMKKRVFVSARDVQKDSKGLFTTKPIQETPRSLIKFPTSSGSTRLTELLGEDIFQHPKSVDLLSHLIELSVSKGDVVLDFFSGSASAADAVMSLNAKKSLGLKYILVQLEEAIDEESTAYEANYRTIDQIGRARIKKAAANLMNSTHADIDYGFKLFRVEEPTQKSLDEIEKFDPSESHLFDLRNVDAFAPVSGTAGGYETILTTWLVRDGQGLEGRNLHIIKLEGYELPVSGKFAYIIREGFDNADLAKLVELIEENQLQIRYVVYLPYTLGFHMANGIQSAFTSMKNNKTVTLEARF